MKVIEPIRLLQDAIVYVLCVIPIVVLREFAEPFHRGFYCDDESIRYPNLPSTISIITMVIVGVTIPAATILFVEAYRLYKIEPRLHAAKKRTLNNSSTVVDLIDDSPPPTPMDGVYLFDRPMPALVLRLCTYGGAFLFGASVCETLTDVAKITVGSLRPHFLDACRPDWTTINCTDHKYIVDFVCTNTDRTLIREARQSFPSGHASFAAYCACYTVLYLRRRASWPLGASTGRLVRPMLQYALVLTAFGTGLTRIADNQHHGVDVIVGFVLGVSTAYATCYHFEICGGGSQEDDGRRREDVEEDGSVIRRMSSYKRLTTRSEGSALGSASGGDKETCPLLYQAA